MSNLQNKINEIAKVVLAEQLNWEKDLFKGFKKFSKIELEKRIDPLFRERNLVISLENGFEQGHELVIVFRITDTETQEHKDVKIFSLQKKALAESGDDTSGEATSQAIMTNSMKQFYNQEICLMISEPTTDTVTANQVTKCKFQTLQELKDSIINNVAYTSYPEYVNLIIDLCDRYSSVEVLQESEELLDYTINQWFKQDSLLSKNRTAFFQIYKNMSDEEKKLIYLPTDCQEWKWLKELEIKYLK